LQTLSEQLAVFINELKFKDLSQEIIKKAKLCLLDFTGVAVASSDCFPAKVLRNQFSSGCSGVASVIGQRSSLHPITAALINGTCGHYLDMDDGEKASISHPGTVIFPAALAISQVKNCKGSQLIEAVVLGYEVICRLGSAMQPSHQTVRGFHTTGTCGTIGAAVSAAKLLGLNKLQIVNAIGLAALQASGLLEVMNTGGMSKSFQAGKAAACGVLSALMASEGMEGPSTALDGPKGFINAMADNVQISLVSENLGTPDRILNVYFKFHAACGLVHSSIDALLELKEQYQFELNDIRQIVLKVQSYAAEVVGINKEPKTAQGMKFSLPMNAGLVLVFGDASPMRYTEENLKNTSVKHVAKLTKVFADKELDTTFPILRSSVAIVKLKSGKIIQKRIDAAKGHPENPATDKDIVEKYLSLSDEYMGKTMANTVLEQIMCIENNTGIATMVKKMIERSYAK